MLNSQFKYLKQRLDKAFQDRNPRYEKDEKEPLSVIKARRVVEKWSSAQARKYSKKMTVLRNKQQKCLEVLMVGDFVKALAAIKKFEALN